jgi:hypothetical protein
MSIGNGKQAKKEVGVNIRQDELSFLIRDGALGAVWIARGSEYADALSRACGADEHSGLG